MRIYTQQTRQDNGMLLAFVKFNGSQGDTMYRVFSIASDAIIDAVEEIESVS
jgi:hypothetical protein